MQTFLPYADPRASAAVLDDRRLGKQRVETFQVLRALTWPTYGWKHHPVVRMWRGFVPALVAYGLACVDEWVARGHADATRAALFKFTGGVEPDWDELHDAGSVPPWVGDDALHLSHRSALVRKEPEFYRPLFGDVPDDLPYVWPDPSFPRWPVRRGGDRVLDPAEAVQLLGLDALPPGADDVVAALAAGHDVHLEAADGVHAPTMGLLAGLCTRARRCGSSTCPRYRAALRPRPPVRARAPCPARSPASRLRPTSSPWPTRPAPSRSSGSCAASRPPGSGRMPWGPVSS